MPKGVEHFKPPYPIPLQTEEGGAENLNALDYGMINRALEFGRAQKIWWFRLFAPIVKGGEKSIKAYPNHHVLEENR